MSAIAAAPAPTTTPTPCAVRDVEHGVGLFAARPIEAGATILEIRGTLQGHATRYSIQLDAGLHIEADAALPDHEMRLRHPWRFLNHCCDPNARVEGRTLVARRAIRADEQITFDYTTTEASMAEPFACLCGASGCVGSVQGFLHLHEAQQAARRTRLAPHLRALLPVR